MVTTCCPNCTPDPRDNIPPDLLSTRTSAFGTLLANFTDQSMGLPTVAHLAGLNLYQLSVWSQLPGPSEAIARVRQLQRTRISITAALNGTEAVGRLQALMYDTPPETSRKAAGALLRLIDHPEDAIKPSNDDDNNNRGNDRDNTNGNSPNNRGNPTPTPPPSPTPPTNPHPDPQDQGLRTKDSPHLDLHDQGLRTEDSSPTPPTNPDPPEHRISAPSSFPLHPSPARPSLIARRSGSAVGVAPWSALNPPPRSTPRQGGEHPVLLSARPPPESCPQLRAWVARRPPCLP